MKKLVIVVTTFVLVFSLVGPVSADSAYRVQPGDNLSRIAARFGVTVPALMAANRLTNPNLIQIGQTLVIPGVGDGGSGPAGGTYVVQRGDNLAGSRSGWG
jgi:LysM repeat protein